MLYLTRKIRVWSSQGREKDKLFFLITPELMLLLLLLLSHISRVWFCATTQMAAHQAPPSLGFSRQEHWSGLPFPSPMHKSEKWKWSRSVVSNSSHPMDCSLPGSSIHGIFQAKVLEWDAIAFSLKDANQFKIFCRWEPFMPSCCYQNKDEVA